MTELDAELILEVYAIVQEFGKDITFEVPNEEASIDDATGKLVSTATTPSVWKCSPPTPIEDRYRGGEAGPTDEIAEVELYAPTQGIPFTPRKGWQVGYDGLEFTIVSVESLYSGDLVAAYRVRISS